MLDPKKPLSITLTEPLVFLRTPDPSGRHQSDPSDPPTLVRGILTLNVAKPMGISSIEVELTGMSTISCPEAIGSRRVDLPERSKIYSSNVTVFRADQVPRRRLSTSLGPGLSLSSANSNEDGCTATASSCLPSLPRGRSDRRDVMCMPVNLGPTPPYTVAQSPPIQPRIGAHGEHPGQTLEELRQSLRVNLEAAQQALTPQSCRSSVISAMPNPAMHSDTSSSSNDSFHQENDGRTDDMHMSSSMEGATSFHSTAGDLSQTLPRQGSLWNCPTRARSPESLEEPQPSHGNILKASNTPASQSRLRLSLHSVLDAVREIASRAPSRSRSMARLEEMERGRTRARIAQEEKRRTSILGICGGVGPGDLGPSASCSSGHTDHREYHLLGLGRVLGLERDHEKDKDEEQKSKEQGESWREFKPGTYSYPISFLLPPHLPPTFSLPNGSLDYAIKGVAHRPGTFTSKLSCQVPLLVVASPAIGAGEDGVAGDPGPLFVQKQWQAKLAYSLGLSSRLFLLGSGRYLGAAASEMVRVSTESILEVGMETRAEAVYGTATLELTLLPIEKIKIWKLDLLVDQRIRYTDGRGRPCRDDDGRVVKLLALQDACPAEELDLMGEADHAHKNKHKQKPGLTRIPLLPTPLSPHRSPLLRHLPPSTDPSILAGPGPYTLSINIGLPGCSNSSGGDSGPLYFTVKQKSSRVKVEHFLRLIMRVESVGEEDTNDKGEEKKKLFDIAVQTPITILSCRCVPEYQTLPRYSPITEDSSQDCVACPCQPNTAELVEEGQGHDLSDYSGHVTTPSPASSFDSVNATTDEPHSGHDHSELPSRAGQSGHTNSPSGPLPVYPLMPPPASGGAREAGWAASHAHAQIHSHVRHHHARAHAHGRSHSYPASTSHMQTHSQTPPSSTPHHSRPPSPLARYERLVSGLESEAGEAPPSYESVASGP